MDLLPGVRSQTAATERLRVHWIESGPADGVPVVLLHGNLSTGRFYEHLMPGAPAGLRLIAPDMRGFGDTERVPIDATRGLRDWADDTAALLDVLGITRPVHLAGWSTGGAAIAAFAAGRPAASLTFIDPVSPYGYGGVRRDGTPCCPDYAGSGGGTGSPDFTRRIADGDRSSDDPASPRNVMNASYWSPEHREPRRPRGDPARRDPQVADRRRRLPGRPRAVGELADGGARDARDPQRALAEALRLVRHRRARPEAAGAVDARDGGHRRRRRRGVGDRDAREARARSRDGRARRRSRRSPWSRRSATSSSATATPAATS